LQLALGLVLLLTSLSLRILNLSFENNLRLVLRVVIVVAQACRPTVVLSLVSIHWFTRGECCHEGDTFGALCVDL
jgi:hypothetical protein